MGGGAGPGERVLVVVLFGLNALFHLLWSPLFFKLPAAGLGACGGAVPVPVDRGANGGASRRFPALASALLAPYLLWVGFAAWLNLAIVRLNRPFGQIAARPTPDCEAQLKR